MEQGEFYTPHSIVNHIASIIESTDGTIYDPCCGSGGMFVQSMKIIEAHGGNKDAVSVYGQESEATLTLRPLGEFFEECDERNEMGEFAIADVRVISINKSVISTKADMTGVSLSSYKQFKHNEFCVVTVTSRKGGSLMPITKNGNI